MFIYSLVFYTVFIYLILFINPRQLFSYKRSDCEASSFYWKNIPYAILSAIFLFFNFQITQINRIFKRTFHSSENGYLLYLLYFCESSKKTIKVCFNRFISFSFDVSIVAAIIFKKTKLKSKREKNDMIHNE